MGAWMDYSWLQERVRMKAIIATEEVLNEHVDLIKIIYHYEDGSKNEKNIFILASQLAKRHKALKG